MSRRIFKYPVEIRDHFGLDLPRGARVLSVQVQRDEPMMWALVDPDAPSERAMFRVIGTGHPIDDPPETLDYVGTFQIHWGGACISPVPRVPAGSDHDQAAG